MKGNKNTIDVDQADIKTAIRFLEENSTDLNEVIAWAREDLKEREPKLVPVIRQVLGSPNAVFQLVPRLHGGIMQRIGDDIWISKVIETLLNPA